ncbi:hypothetical protein CAEBREN_04678 [Caenorhabditis brenneri]|uniref:Uncharacterized protein n=1 Tax=Caenorhabditis brenneri TaxID=135651 RepID=G0NSG1_CAEBE|nr:hypothetical protein CAEBREN_04678 [Caenorhabditis brenneri]
MKVLFIFFSLLFSIATCQQLINLSSFKGGNVKNQLNGGKKYGIFVSALADSSDLLQNISVVQEDGEVVTLEKLKNLKASNESGELKPYVVSHSAYVTTNLTIDDMEQLTGVMYLCTPNQLNDNDLDGTTTTAFNTTGLIMNQIGWQDDQITFYTMRDEQYSGSVGANIVGNLSANGEVTISVYGDFIYHDFSTPLNGGPIVPWSAPTIGQTFEASSNVTHEQYYVQFFVRQGQLIPVTSTTTMTNTTTPPSTSTVPPTSSGGVTITGNVETTTNSSGTIRILFLVALTSFIVLLPNRK